jgi:2-desacetyl-2-hydroxyethyl bacteriochlorophyllide A dehydrogenase
LRAFVISGPREAAVIDVAPPVAGAGQVVVDVARVGLCGTDVELFDGTMPYLLDGSESYPIRPGHEWAGVVKDIGPDVDESWRGTAVTGDTMLGCGKCSRCLRGRHHVCADRYEIGIRGGWPGALAEQLLVPVTALRRLPPGLDPSVGALVEPAGCALRAVDAAAIEPGHRVCVIGPGTLGLLAVQFAMLRGAIVDLVGVAGVDDARLSLGQEFGANTVTTSSLESASLYDAVIDTSNSPGVPALALSHVEPAGRLVLIGLADTPSTIDSRHIAYRDVTVVGILAASAALDAAIQLLASGRVQTKPLIAATVGLDRVADVFRGWRPPDAGPGPKFQVDPRPTGNATEIRPAESDPRS